MIKPKRKYLIAIVIVLLVAAAFIVYQWWPRGPRPGSILDEARLANRPRVILKRPMKLFPPDGPEPGWCHPVDDGEVKGRNTWVVWTGGNDRLWDNLTVASVGALDLLKTLSSYPNPISFNPGDKLKFSRDNRWAYLGLVNEPCFEKASGPDPERFGLWLDKRIVSTDCPPDPFENETKYPV